MNYQINKVLIGIFLLVTLASCLNNGQCDDCGQIPMPKPSQKELAYIDTLKERGLKNIKLIIPLIGEYGYGRNYYAMELDCPFELKHQNTDSIIAVRNEIADELYSNIIEDSIIMDCYEIDLRFNFQKKEFDPYKNDNLTDGIKISVLEKRNGFRVVKVGKNKFKRVHI
jgi:hypothetical protein